MFIRKYNKGLQSLLCVIDSFCKYEWVISLKDKKIITIARAFQKVLNEFGGKPNKILVDKGRKSYNRSIKSRFKENGTKIYSRHNEGKTVVCETLIRTLKNKTYKYVILISKNVYINRLSNIVNECSNTYHSTIQIHSADVKSSMIIDFAVKNNDKDPKYEAHDHKRRSKYKSIFAKGLASNWFEEVL